MNKKTLLLGCNWYPTKYQNTKGIFFKNHAEAFSQKKYISKVVIFCVSTSIKDFLEKGFFKKIIESKKIISIHITIPLGRFINSGKFISFFTSFSYEIFVKKELKGKVSNQLIFLSQNISSLSNFLEHESIKLNAKHIVIEHSTGLENYSKRYALNLKKSLIKSEIYTVSKSLKKKLRTTYKLDSKDTINCLSPQWTKISRELLLKPTKIKQIKNLIFVGHLIPRKNILNLIKAFIRLKQTNITLTIVGDGYLRKKCHEIAEEDKRIKFIQKVGNDSLPNIYREHDLLILPSLEETFGVVLIEAASQGCQIATTISGGPEEIIGKIKNGYLINGFSIKELNLFLKNIINQTYNENKIIKNILNEYSSEKFIETLKI